MHCIECNIYQLYSTNLQILDSIWVVLNATTAHTAFSKKQYFVDVDETKIYKEYQSVSGHLLCLYSVNNS